MSASSEPLGHGQVWWADQDKVRPVVILTRASVADLLARVLVAPVTTSVRGIGSEVALGEAEGLTPGCVANLDNVHLVARRALLKKAGQVDETRWHEFCRAMSRVMACPRT